ncbi:reverse transcriptase [Elysia marginata]|uniref:Reverse transcriptase n=1 Tax=Elysia marginata TaxID=1093978 RepID=A0AAV4IVA1_9GAST|nr:reverse transcriptase [Elysia marginata]
MDDTTIICSKEVETPRMLVRLDTLMAWCRMKFKPKKSRSLPIRKGLSDVAMYCGKAKLKLPMKSILEDIKCGKARLVTMLEYSDDPVVKLVQPSIKTDREWNVTEAIDEAKECLRMKEVIGQTQTDRKGLGSSLVKWWPKTEGKKERPDHR